MTSKCVQKTFLEAFGVHEPGLIAYKGKRRKFIPLLGAQLTKQKIEAFIEKLREGSALANEGKLIVDESKIRQLS